MTISDLEYRFEQLPVEIDGQPAIFSGVAFLSPDPAGFWVAMVALDGPGDRLCPLDRGGSLLARRLSAAITETLYDRCPEARDAWAAHVEQEKQDAA